MAKVKFNILKPRTWFARSQTAQVVKDPTPVVYAAYNNAAVSLLWSTDPALCIATVYRCVKLISETVASLPLRYMVYGKDGIYKDAYGSTLTPLLRVQPNPDYNAFDFWAAVTREILLEGNAYIVPQYVIGTGYTSLTLCKRKSVSYNRESRVYTIDDPENGIVGTFAENEVIHLKGMSTDPKVGASVLSFHTGTLSIARESEAESLDRIRSGGQVRAIVSNSKSEDNKYFTYDDGEVAKVADTLEMKLNDQHRRIVASPGLVDVKQLQMSSADMQLIQMRQFNVRDICRAFGVHPSFVFDDTSSNYKSAEMANAAFLSNTLNPILRQIESELLRKLVAPEDWTYRKFEFDRRGLYACDLQSKSDYYLKMVQSGAYTVNDVRRMENMPMFEGGDVPLISANLRPLNETIITESNEKE